MKNYEGSHLISESENDINATIYIDGSDEYNIEEV